MLQRFLHCYLEQAVREILAVQYGPAAKFQSQFEELVLSKTRFLVDRILFFQ